METSEIKLVLGITAALLHSAAYIIYNIQAKLGQSKPKAASWGVWAFLAVINASAYDHMTADTFAALQFYVGSIACIFTFIYTWRIGSLGRPTRREWYFFGMGIVATTFWIFFQHADWAVLIILSAFLISFVPTYVGVRDNPSHERSRPWILWTIAFAITLVNKSIGITDMSVITMGLMLGFASPAILLVAHGLIAVLARKS